VVRALREQADRVDAQQEGTELARALRREADSFAANQRGARTWALRFLRTVAAMPHAVMRGGNDATSERARIDAHAAALKLEAERDREAERRHGRPKPSGYGACPRCGQDVTEGKYGATARERRPNGNTRCGACGLISPSLEWPSLHTEGAK
jgi:hypothetical protein